MTIHREEHAAYLQSGLGVLAQHFTSLDASRPWLTYWITHALELLGPKYALTGEFADHVVSFLASCQVPETGGFAGGPHPGQSAHLAPTYAAINTLVTLGTPAALAVVDRPSLRRFLLRMKTEAGGFTMHDDGESDVSARFVPPLKRPPRAQRRARPPRGSKPLRPTPRPPRPLRSAARTPRSPSPRSPTCSTPSSARARPSGLPRARPTKAASAPLRERRHTAATPSAGWRRSCSSAGSTPCGCRR